MKLPPSKYILAVLIAISSSFCAYFPLRTNYLGKIKNLDQADLSWSGTMLAILWMPNFIFFMPIIFGYLVDTIGVLPMLLPMQLLLLVGQIILTISTIIQTNQELTAIAGFFFVSFSYKGIELAQTVFLMNTFVRINKDTKVYQKLMLVSKFINTILINFTLLWRDWLPLNSGEIFGCLLSILGIAITILLIRSSWAKNNVEEIASNPSILRPITKNSIERLDYTFSNFNARDSTDEYRKGDPVGITFGVVFLMVGIACAWYLLETLSRYYLTAFGFTKDNTFGWSSILPLFIELGSLATYSFFDLSEKVLGRLILTSCVLLFFAIFLSFTGVFAGILFFVALALNPDLLELYLPFMVKMNFNRLGLFVGCYNWIEVCVNIFALGYGAIVGKDGKSYFNDLKNFYWGGSNYYLFVAVPFTMIMVIGLIVYIASPQKVNVVAPKGKRAPTFSLGEEEDDESFTKTAGERVNVSMSIFTTPHGDSLEEEQ